MQRLLDDYSGLPLWLQSLIALCALAVAALTVYDMCKAVDRGMKITDVRLVHKAGSKSGTFEAE